MAFSKAPSQDTYQTKPFKLIWALFNKFQTVREESIAVNGFFDVVKDKATRDDDYKFIKRPGVSVYPYSVNTTNIRGMYYWEDKDKFYIAYDSSIAIVKGSTGVLETLVTPFTSTSGEVGFTEFYYEDGTTKVVIGDGVVLVTLDASNVVAGPAAGVPSPFNPAIVYLDGYLFVVKAGTSDIYNSNLSQMAYHLPASYLVIFIPQIYPST